MCGIIAISSNTDKLPGLDAFSIAERLIRQFRHRGPDGIGVVGNRAAAIAMSRLRIRSEAREPIPFYAEKEKTYVAFNGEIYGHRKGGSRFMPCSTGGPEEVAMLLSSTSDPISIDGMYASVASSELFNGLRVTRDPFGIKPLFIRDMDDGVLVASEIGALVEGFGPLRLRQNSIAQFLAFGRPIDGLGFIEGISSVPPGGRLLLGNGRIYPEPRMDVTDFQKGNYPNIDLKSAIREAVERTHVSDQTLGLAVSGGLDSSILAYELHQLNVKQLKTVSVIVAGSPDGLRSIDQLALGHGAVRSWEHSTCTFTPDDLPGGIETVTRRLGEPTSLTSAPLFGALSDCAAAQGIVVMLLGEGADELFGGYLSYLMVNGKRSVEETFKGFYLPPERLSLLGHLLGPGHIDECKHYLNLLALSLKELEPFEAIRRFELAHSLEPLLRRADILLMTNSIEGRTPYLHGDIARIAFGLRMPDLISDNQTKLALRSAYRGLLDRNIGEKSKTAFRIPITNWFSGPLFGYVSASLVDGSPLLREVGIRVSGIEVLLQAIKKKNGEACRLAFCLISLLSWIKWMMALGALDLHQVVKDFPKR
jgi:asparagine synthase (glutamine-hydrolysing)